MLLQILLSTALIILSIRATINNLNGEYKGIVNDRNLIIPTIHMAGLIVGTTTLIFKIVPLIGL